MTEQNGIYPASKASDEVWWAGCFQCAGESERTTVEARIAAAMRINLAKILAVTRNNLHRTH